jgi:UDP-N-acetylmuramate dehydrogenase
VLGNGSNLLVRDEGVRGVVIRIRRGLERVSVAGEIVTVEAGALFPTVANQTAAAGLTGLEFGAGIPGTLGGALVMNAGWHEHEIGNVVETVDVLAQDGSVATLDRETCGFRYRGSALRDRPERIVLGARLRLAPDDPARVRERLERFAASRKANQPTAQPSCGSVFLQPPGDYAGRLIDAAGLKGTRVGAIEVSPLHANFFVNHGGGTARDVLALVDRVEAEVERRFGVRLEREFELW